MKFILIILFCASAGIGVYFLRQYIEKKALEREIDNIKIHDDTFDLPENKENAKD